MSSSYAQPILSQSLIPLPIPAPEIFPAPANQTSQASFLDLPAFTFAEVAALSLKLPTLKDIPYGARTAVSVAFASTLRAANTSAGIRRSNASLLVYAFQLLVLHRPPPATHRQTKLVTIVNERARLWTRPNGPSQLWQSAIETVRLREAALGARNYADSRPPAENTTRSEDTSYLGPIAHLLSGESEFAISDIALIRSGKCAEVGMYSRALSALGSHPLASPTADIIEQLQSLNPPNGLPLMEQIRCTPQDVAPITEREIVRWCTRFPNGASFGPSGSRIELFIQMVHHVGANVAFEAAGFLTLLMRNELDQEATQAFFSAKLLAPFKDSSTATVRPIACGEVYRRLTGKIILARVSEEAANYLTTRKQFAVGVGGGSEAIIHAVQKLIKAYITDPVSNSRKVFVKGDLKNAYNICSRLKMLLAAQQRLPGILPYLIAAYARSTTLHFGETQILSESGTQQGDPMSTLAFSLVLAEACGTIPSELHERLDLEAWFADDSNVGGDIDDVIALFESLEALGPEFGYEFRRDKYQVYCARELHHEASARFRTQAVFTFEESHTLGAPTGTQQFVDAFASRLVRAAESTFNRILALPEVHQAGAVLAFCGRGIATHLCRTSLPSTSILRQLDDAFVNTAASIYNITCNAEVIGQMQDKYTKGGDGYRPTATIASIAYIAAELETKELQSRILKSEFMEDTVSRLLADPGLLANLDPSVVESIRESLQSNTRMRQLQKKWSAILDSRRQLPDDIQNRARILSCAGSHHTLHPVILHGEKFEWLPNAHCTVIMRMRHGLPVYDREQPCPFCRSATSDVYGRHVLSCLHGGHHTRAHHRARDDIAKIAAKALASPTLEAPCFIDAPTRRTDILMRGLTIQQKPVAADYALVSHSQRLMLPAASSIGGAATAYEAVKRREYGTLAEQSGLFLAPMIQDVYGAWGDTARSVLALLARREANRSGAHRGSVALKNRRWLLSRAQRRIADILLLATPAPAQSHIDGGNLIEPA